MKYSEFLQMREILESTDRTISDVLKNPDILLEKAIDAQTIVQAFNDKKVVLDAGKKQVGLLGPNNEIVGRVKIDTFQKTLADNKDALTHSVRETPIPMGQIATATVGQKIDPTQLSTVKPAEAFPAIAANTGDAASAATAAASNAAGSAGDAAAGAAGAAGDAAGAATDAAASGAEAAAGTGTAAKAALAKGVFGAISSNAILFGVAGAGAAAIVAWVMRRQIIKAVWIKKLKNNTEKIKKQIDKLLLKNITPMFDQKDQMIKKEKLIDAKMKETKDENTKKRLESLKGQLNKMQGDWEEKFVDMINQTIDTVVDGKTQELNKRIDGLKDLQPGQKISLKNIWSTMMINLKAEGWKRLTKLKLIAGDDVLAKITNDIKAELAKEKKKTTANKKKLEPKYKTIKSVKIADTDVKFGQWYLYEKSKDEDNENPLKGNKYVRFIYDGEALGEGEEAYIAEIREVGYNDKTGAMTKKKLGEFSTPEELQKIVKTAGIKEDTKPVDLDKFKKNMTKTPEQEAEIEKNKKTPEQKAEIEKNKKALAALDPKKREELAKKTQDLEKFVEKNGEDDPKSKEHKQKMKKILQAAGFTVAAVGLRELFKLITA